MTEPANGTRSDPKPPQPTTLPRRDYLLLPLISLTTILLLLGCSEVLARVLWSERKANDCKIEDSIVGGRFKPNCTVRSKNAEGPWTTEHYNECGYRSATSCGPKPPGALRIVIIGSSVSQGLYVPYDQTYFALASSELSGTCRRTVDVQNLGVVGLSSVNVYRRIDEALALRPDVVLYLIAPFDLEQQIDPKELAERNNSAPVGHQDPGHAARSPMKRLQSSLSESRTALVAQHFLFQNRDTFLRTYLLYSDKADFLRQPVPAAWQRRYANFDVLIGDMADRMRAAGVPFVVIPVPSRAESALLSSEHVPAGVDPFAFGRTLEGIAAKHGAGYIDLMEPFRRIPNSENLFYVVDGHVTAEGQKEIAQNIVQKLQDGSVPAFSHCAVQQSSQRER
jgi:hypothetical protein